MANWVDLGKRAVLLKSGRRVVKAGGKQVLLIEAGGVLHAVNNRCPHEGYPLSEGTLGPSAEGADCALTCNWHNWKFDLMTGETLNGGDSLRHYPVEERAGHLWIDVEDAPAAERQAKALASLLDAFDDYETDRMARETVRFIKADGDPFEPVRHAIHATHDRFEYGMTHAYAAAPDWLALRDTTNDPGQRLIAVVEPISHMAWDTRRAPHYAFTTATRAWDAGAFLAAIEGEREDDAVALLRGALASGLTFADLRPTFARAALAHYQDFGHSAIYVHQANRLIELLGAGVTEPVLLALVRSLVTASREDLIPEFRGYAKTLARFDGTGTKPVAATDLVGLSVNATMNRVLESSADIPMLFDALVDASAQAMLRYDLAVGSHTDLSVSHNIHWLDFTHALTFANAVRVLCTETPSLWPAALLQLACFLGRNAAFLGVDESARWQVVDAKAFVAQEQAKLFDHGVPEPIIVCHRVKVLGALGAELARGARTPWTTSVPAAVNRYLNTPIKRRHSLREARQALDFVAAEG